MFEIIDIQPDIKLSCCSVLTKVSISNFVGYITPIHENKGNIEEQREVVQTKSAKTIRQRMIEDIQEGGLLPPIVLGAVVEKFEENDWDIFLQNTEVSIIDGMQRTEALRKALEGNPAIAQNLIRVEFWIAEKQPQALLYRMLVLNTGQIPWKLEKQLAVIFKDILSYLKVKFDINIAKEKEGFHAELFSLFTTRRIDTKKQDILADNFAILDTIEILRKGEHTLQDFGVILDFLFRADYIVAEKLNLLDPKETLFSTKTTVVGFVVACSTYIYGKNGMTNVPIQANFEKLQAFLQHFLVRLEQTTDVQYFLALDTLEEMMSVRPKSNIGEHQRLFYFKSFEFLLQNYEQIETLEPCWRVNF